MPSYMSYMRQMSVLDEDGEIESWITVKGNHIPIRKGQSKEDAVKSFIEKKGGDIEKKSKAPKKRETYTTAEGFEFYKDTNEPVKKGGYTLADKKGNIILQANFVDNTKSYNDKGLYQDALNELDDQIAEKEKELENIHLSMTENAESGYFDIASANMEDIEFVKGQLNELKKKREKLAGSSGTKAPKVTKVDAKKWNSPASDPWKSLYD